MGGGNLERPLFVVLYGITLVTLAEDLWAADLGLLTPFYSDDAAFDRSSWRSAQIFKLLMKRGIYHSYLPKLSKSLCIADLPDQEATAKREFAVEGLDINFVGGSWYLGGYLIP